MTGADVTPITGPNGIPNLSVREMQIISLLCQGMKNKAIASELMLQPDTVKTYMSRIFAKASVTNRTQLAMWARENRLIFTMMVA